MINEIKRELKFKSMSKYRLMENNGLYKIEEYKKIGLFGRRYAWVQETQTKLSKSYEHVIRYKVYYENRENALQRLEELRLKEIRTSDEWKEVKV
jgi:hypothetical protein